MELEHVMSGVCEPDAKFLADLQAGREARVRHCVNGFMKSGFIVGDN